MAPRQGGRRSFDLAATFSGRSTWSAICEISLKWIYRSRGLDGLSVPVTLDMGLRYSRRQSEYWQSPKLERDPKKRFAPHDCCWQSPARSDDWYYGSVSADRLCRHWREALTGNVERRVRPARRRGRCFARHVGAAHAREPAGRPARAGGATGVVVLVEDRREPRRGAAPARGGHARPVRRVVAPRVAAPPQEAIERDIERRRCEERRAGDRARVGARTRRPCLEVG